MNGIPQALNPADYFTLALDDESRREGMPGGLCGYVLELRQPPDLAQLTARLEEFAQRFPLVGASLQQRGRRFYWVPRANPPPLFYDEACPEGEDEARYQQRFLETLLNQRETREAVAPISFHLLRGTAQCWLAMRWLHPFCDARGADLVLQYLCCDDPARRAAFGEPADALPLLGAKLAQYLWWQKIALFLKAKRYIQEIDRLPSILPPLSGAAPERLAFAVQRLDAADSARIAELARQQAGIGGTSLYTIGCLMRALRRVDPQAPGEAYCATYAFNLRKQRALAPLFGNHVGGLFAQAPRGIVEDRAALFQHLKQQNARVIRGQLDYAFLPLMWAGSHLPLAKYGKTLRQSPRSGSERSSFWFSDIGQPEMPGGQCCGAEITGMLHLCQPTSPPALAVLNCSYRQRVTITYNFVEPLLQHDWITRLQAAVREELLGG